MIALHKPTLSATLPQVPAIRFARADGVLPAKRKLALPD